jgi:hypothetical protein
MHLFIPLHFILLTYLDDKLKVPNICALSVNELEDGLVGGSCPQGHFELYFDAYLLSLPLARWYFLQGRFVYQTGPILRVMESIVLLLGNGSGRFALTVPNAGLFSLVGAVEAVTGMGALIIGAEMLATLNVFFSSPGVLDLPKKLNRPV